MSFRDTIQQHWTLVNDRASERQRKRVAEILADDSARRVARDKRPWDSPDWDQSTTATKLDRLHISSQIPYD